MNNPLASFLDKVGRVEFQAGIDMSTQLMNRALNDGGIPAHRYKAAKEWCEANGFDCPMEIFKWQHGSRKSQSTKQYAKPVRKNQAPRKGKLNRAKQNAQIEATE